MRPTIRSLQQETEKLSCGLTTGTAAPPAHCNRVDDANEGQPGQDHQVGPWLRCARACTFGSASCRWSSDRSWPAARSFWRGLGGGGAGGGARLLGGSGALRRGALGIAGTLHLARRLGAWRRLRGSAALRTASTLGTASALGSAARVGLRRPPGALLHLAGRRPGALPRPAARRPDPAGPDRCRPSVAPSAPAPRSGA